VTSNYPDRIPGVPVTLLFNPMNRMVTMPAGCTVLEAIREAGILFEAICGGKGICGKCRVIRIGGNCTEDTDACSQWCSAGERNLGYKLACNTKVWSDAEFTIPIESRIDQPQILLTTGVDVEDMNPAAGRYPVQVITGGPSALLGPSIRIRDYNGQRPALSRKMISDITGSDIPVSLLISSAGGKPEVIGIEYGISEDPVCGIAIDLGTTTIAALLVNLQNGKVITKATTLNRQITHGEELVTRLALGRSASGLATLQSAAVESINDVITNVLMDAGIKNENVIDCCMGGNTVMSWIFAGIDPSPLEYVDAEVPSTPVLLRAGDTGLMIHSHSWVWSLPAVSRFVGGDAVGDLISARIDQTSDICLMMDLGTNGEIVLGNKDWLVSTSCASGPAFEGSGLCCGMRAMNGAIEHVIIDPATGVASVKVIGGTLPKGICGSGIIDAAPAMAAAGILDFSGKLVEGAPGVIHTRDGPVYILVPAAMTGTDKDIIITEQDMAYLMDTKAAVCGAISVLMMKYRLTIGDIRHVYLAGAFGTYGSVDKLTEFGIIPEFPNAEFHRLGNGSLTGAYRALLSTDARNRAVQIAERMAYIDLLVDTGFIEEYWAALRIPGKEELFPHFFKRPVIGNQEKNT
jgi:uncharacterized 2Fe-2S/4Fe-4S cluster protein (DUF4445 family)